ncbi:MAG: hypothetical protein WC718_00090 [Phycisphaerales bacterium]|jgi:hypothetical protein
MIAIVNTGPHDDPDKLGERTYEVRINREVVAMFQHHRGDGLAECLRKAAAAVERRQDEDVMRLLQRIDKMTPR